MTAPLADRTRATGRTPASSQTMPLRAEVRRQLGRRRTQAVFWILLALPLLLLAAFSFGTSGGTGGSGATLVDLATTGTANFTIFALFAASGFLFSVLVSLFAGDTVPAEASWSSLRYLLAAGIPRARLLTRKLTVAALSTVLALVLLPLVSVVVGGLAYGWGGFLAPDGSTLSWSLLWWRLPLVLVYIAVSLLPVGALAAWFGVWTDAPLGAVGGAVLVTILSSILDSITALGGLRQVLPTHFAYAWFDLLQADIAWDQLARGTLYAVIWAVGLLVAAYVHFLRKDVLS